MSSAKRTVKPKADILNVLEKIKALPTCPYPEEDTGGSRELLIERDEVIKILEEAA